ncbi:hypothetical protein ACFYSF_39515 [Streptomyces canus]|uniref:hypothetical protein n=1 Tax=Streptomyces canus TaxID=58343 RepID=UPI0036CA93A8
MWARRCSARARLVLRRQSIGIELGKHPQQQGVYDCPLAGGEDRERFLVETPTAYLPGWLHPLSEILPVGVGVRAVQGLSHFNNDGLTAGIVVLVAWILVAAVVLFVLDARGPRRAAVD